jgi:flagellar biosynthetic protein FliQ
MSIGEVTAIIRQGVFQVLIMASPLLIPALVVGLLVAILQATMSVQEQTLTFVPKIFVILIVLALLGGWMLSSLEQYTTELFRKIPDMVR